jgi:hypothetical protein
MAPKYGIQVPWPDGAWLWVTQGDSKFHIAPMLFDTQAQAETYAATVWGPQARVEPYVNHDQDHGDAE